MNLLLLTHKFYPDIGGIEVNSEILAEYFTFLGAQVHLITWSFKTDDKTFPYTIIRRPGLSRLWKEHKWADVVFENNPTLKLAWPTFFLKKKHVIAVRTLICRNDGRIQLQDKIKLKCLKKANAVIAVSQFIRGSSFSGAIVIGNPYRDKLFIETNFGNREKDFVFLGRLVSDKGADMAINLLKMLHTLNKPRMTNLKLTIIGDGPERITLEKMVQHFALGNFIEFKGFMEGKDLVECLNRHKYLLVPSRCREAFGNIALEGMACGCLPIVSGGGGLPDAVGDAGLVFERDNLESLFAQVKELLENSILESSLRSNSHKHLLNHRTEIVAKKYFNVIEKSCCP